MIELGKYTKTGRADRDIIEYSIEDQTYELNSGFIILNRHPDCVQIRYSSTPVMNLHKKSRVYFYSKDDPYDPIKSLKYVLRLMPALVPKIIGYQQRVVALRIEPDTSQIEIMAARKQMFSLAKKISSYWA